MTLAVCRAAQERAPSTPNVASVKPASRPRAAAAAAAVAAAATTAPVMPEEQRPRWNDAVIAALLAVLVLLTLLAARPFVGVPMNDDFSYAHTARALAETGRIVYNGHGSPLLLPQAAWGALLIKLFGFSYTALAVSGVVMAALCTAVMYLLARACGCAPFPAALATATLTLNPIFVSVAPSFMTDVPSLFLLLIALLALAKSLRRDAADGEVRIDTGRFALSVALGILAGSNRQVSWVAFLGALGAVAFFVPGKPQRRLVTAGIVLTAVIAALFVRWLDAQPYIVPADITSGLLLMIGYTNVAFIFTYRFLNLLGLFLLPLALAALWGQRVKRGVALPILLLLCLVPVFYSFGTTIKLLSGDYRLTVYGQYFTSAGVVVGGVHGFEKRPLLFPPPVAYVLVLLGAVGLAITVYLLVRWWREVRRVPRQTLTVAQIAASALSAVSLLQIAASLPWYAQINVFDRYLLFLLPGLLILFAAQITQRKPPAGALRLTTLVLGVMWIVSFGFLSEYMNYTRARADLYNRLRRQGVPPQAINGGFEFNASSQVEAEGHLNNPAVVNPPNAFRKDAKARYVTYRPELFPSIDAQYVLSTDPDPDPSLIVPEPVFSTTYRSPIFAPRVRAMYVYRIRR